MTDDVYDSNVKTDLDLKQVAKDLYILHEESTFRGLNNSAKWASELLYCLPIKFIDVKAFAEEAQVRSSKEPIPDADWVSYTAARTFFNFQEYDRAAYYTQTCNKSLKIKFFHLYSRYLAGEKKLLDDMVDSVIPNQNLQNEDLRQLREDLEREYLQDKLDGYCLYLYGVVLKKLQLFKEALDVMYKAVQLEPLQCQAWMELATLVTDKAMIHALELPDHWLKHFFLASAFMEHNNYEGAIETYSWLAKSGFNNSTYIKGQVGIIHNNIREVEDAIDTFKDLLEMDPYRLDNMDVYSHLLYIKEMRVELSHLAQKASAIDKYRVETCCIIGNFYSLRCQHEKAVLYFNKALRLNPNFLSAWTLMGHEYMEMKNTSAAVQAYRQAIEVNRKDYRPWYGLGQTYELLKMPFYSLYYYIKAQQLSPNDPRMIIALGESYEKLDRLQEAKKCYWKANAIGDNEGLALIKLAKLYDKMHEREQAAAAYSDFLRNLEKKGITDRDEQCQSYRYLANYFFQINKLDEAYVFSQKCLDYVETREEGKSLIRQLTNKRETLGMSEIIQVPSPMEEDLLTPSQQQGSSSLSPVNLTYNN